MIPMAICGRWLSPSRLRDLLAIIIPMIEAPTRFNRQCSHQRGEQVRTDQTPLDGHLGAKLDHARLSYDGLATSASQRTTTDVAVMLAWQNNHSFGVDLAHLRAVYPELTTFEAWLDQHRSAVMPREEAGGRA